MKYKELNEIIDNPSDNTSHTFRELWEQFIRNWYWFALGLLLAWVGAYFYLRYSQSLYSAEAKVLIKEDAMQSGSELSALAGKSLGGFDGKSNIADQIEVMRSRRLVQKVVENLQLNVRYFSEGRVKKQELMHEAAPVKIRILSDEISYLNFNLKVLSNTELELTIDENKSTVKFGNSVKIGNNEFIILPQNLNSIKVGSEVQVTLGSIQAATSRILNGLRINALNDGSVVSVSIVDNLPSRAKTIVDELINQYNEDAISDKQLIGEKTTDFIEERLSKVTDDLKMIDRDVEMFKKDNKVIDLEVEGGSSINQFNINHSQYLEKSTQLSMVNAMSEYLENNGMDLIPSNIGLTDQSVNTYAQKYNELILARNDMLNHSTENSQIIQNIDEQIRDVKSNLNNSLNNYKKTIQISLNRIENEGGRISSKIQAFPTQEKEFINIARQQQIIEALYLFLLQKREENEITNSATPSAIKVVDYAYSSNFPISPNSQRIYMMATVLGLALPFGMLYLFFLLNNKVQSRRDLEVTGVTVIGDIPSSKSKELIEVNDNGKLAESLRILRTNIGFYLANKKNETKIIYVTSTLGGEGKTFATSNLSLILASSKKHKVLVVGADIRNPKLLEKLEMNQYKVHKGITEYLVDSELTIDDLIIPNEKFNIDVIHSGIIAPNPSELLMNGRFQKLLDEAIGRYDYVIVDTAPVGLVADTLLIADKADLFLYIVRANFLDKRMLEMPKELYNRKRLPNMSIILNDVGNKKGFGYGSGYGYGYGYGVEEVKGWKKFLPRNLFK